MNFLIGLLILLAVYIVLKGYRAGRENSRRKHGHCCDECNIKDLCDDYKDKRHID